VGGGGTPDAGVGGGGTPDAGVGGGGTPDAGVGGGGSGGCASEDDCSNGELCQSGACVAMQCPHRASNKTGIRAQVQITRYQGLITGRNGVHEIAYGNMQQPLWVDVSSVVDTSSVQLAMDVQASDGSGLPHELPLTAGQTVEVEGEYISGATAGVSGGVAVIHFTHSICGYATIAGTTYQ
jgi:hypothetical protein